MIYVTEDHKVIVDDELSWLLRKYYMSLNGREKKKLKEKLEKRDKELFGGGEYVNV